MSTHNICFCGGIEKKKHVSNFLLKKSVLSGVMVSLTLTSLVTVISPRDVKEVYLGIILDNFSHFSIKNHVLGTH